MGIILWIIAALVLLYLGFTFFLFYIACGRFDMGPRFSRFLSGGKKEPDWASPDSVELAKKGRAWLDKRPAKAIHMTSFDGLALSGTLYENPEAQGILAAFHGFHSSGRGDFASVASFYWQLGFSLLLVDQRACGQSEGSFITYGVRERRDAQDWCRLMAERYPDLPILLAGVSLGATTVLMASDELPDAVRAIVADCGFSSPWQQLEYIARRTVNVPVDFVLKGVDVWCRLFARFGLREWSAQQALAKTKLPVCFIHGQQDKLVPYSCTEVNIAACASPAWLLSVPEAGHGVCFAVDREGYRRTVFDFLEEFFFTEE